MFQDWFWSGHYRTKKILFSAWLRYSAYILSSPELIYGEKIANFFFNKSKWPPSWPPLYMYLNSCEFFFNGGTLNPLPINLEPLKANIEQKIKKTFQHMFWTQIFLNFEKTLGLVMTAEINKKCLCWSNFLFNSLQNGIMLLNKQ